MSIKVIATLDGYKQPENLDAKIWRYMDFSKFVYLLQNSALFFSRADRFKDQSEGKHSNYDYERLKKQVEEMSCDADVNKVIKGYSDAFDRLKEKIFISCWHMSDYQSDAMWKIYCENKEAVAIQTTYSKLKKVVLDAEISQRPEFGMVEYIDYQKHDKPMVGTFHPFFFKKKAYKHESEIRSIVWQPESNEQYGMDIKVDINALIEKIYVSPFADGWFIKLVNDLTKKYGYNQIPVKCSELE